MPCWIIAAQMVERNPWIDTGLAYMAFCDVHDDTLSVPYVSTRRSRMSEVLIIHFYQINSWWWELLLVHQFHSRMNVKLLNHYQQVLSCDFFIWQTIFMLNALSRIFFEQCVIGSFIWNIIFSTNSCGSLIRRFPPKVWDFPYETIIASLLKQTNHLERLDLASACFTPQRLIKSIMPLGLKNNFGWMI